MRSLRSLIDPAGRSLAFHLDRLRHTLDGLLDRVREAVSRAVGEAVAGVVREAVHGALADGGATDFADGPPPGYEARPSRWGEPEDGENPYGAGGLHEGYEDYEGPPPARPARQPSPRWAQALAAGLRAAAWWLLRPPGRYTLLAALGVGGATTAALLAGGPLATAGAGLAVAVLGVGGLGAVVRSATAALDAAAAR